VKRFTVSSGRGMMKFIGICIAANENILEGKGTKD
jgi:hypothetical protein